MLPLLGIEKMEENWFTPNLRNCVHQQKKAPNKTAKFVINRKSLFTSQNEGFSKKMRVHWTEKLLPFESVSEKKMKKTVSSIRNEIF